MPLDLVFISPSLLVHYIAMSPKLNTYSMIYRIVGNFCGRKLSEHKIFTEKTFADCSLVLLPKDATAPNFREIFSQIVIKPQNLQKFSPSKVSPLYSTNNKRVQLPYGFYTSHLDRMTWTISSEYAYQLLNMKPF